MGLAFSGMREDARDEMRYGDSEQRETAARLDAADAREDAASAAGPDVHPEVLSFVGSLRALLEVPAERSTTLDELLAQVRTRLDASATIAAELVSVHAELAALQAETGAPSAPGPKQESRKPPRQPNNPADIVEAGWSLVHNHWEGGPGGGALWVFKNEAGKHIFGAGPSNGRALDRVREQIGLPTK